MSKYILLTVILALSLLIPAVTQAQENITLLDSSTEVLFPSAIVFKVKVQSQSNITRIRLLYQTERMNYAHVISEAWPDFVPSPKVETQWLWDMRKASLPPGATIRYWWTIEDQNGHKLVTNSNTFQFQDLRYSWQKLTMDQVTLFWYKGSESFANGLLTACEQALNRLYQDTGTRLERPVSIFIYANAQDLRAAMIFPREWTGGVAFPEFGTIAIGVSTSQLNWGKRAVAHELGHMVIHQVTFSPYGASLPVWLDEGLAMYAEGESDTYLEALLRKAVSQGRLFSVRSLSSPFSAKPEDAYLSYAQSQSLVEFLIQNYGKDKILQLLYLLKEGNSCDEALLQIYGFDQAGLDKLWQEYITNKTKGTPSSKNTSIKETPACKIVSSAPLISIDVLPSIRSALI